MPMIRQLDPHVADLIAAGEVVERPASVVKELMENAIDAGAGAVTVEIAHGGMSLIRVTDNGCGIPAAQAPTAFLRHATSKIATEYDLEAIGTLGFRGEALAAISAVSRIELLTRTDEEPLGSALSVVAGVVEGQEEAGCPRGTTMTVRELFFNTPARLKFMKKDAAEGAAVFAVVQRTALSHPELSVRFIRDGRQELLTPGDGQLKSAIYAVMGRDIALGFLPVKGSGDGMSTEGFASLPSCCRGSRSYQHFFVNGRYIKSRVMMAAVEEAYKNQKMVGRFPGCVIHLTVKPHEVDVNVHPTKTEVKFQREQAVFSTVYYAVLSALDRDRTRPQAVVSASGKIPPAKTEDTVTSNQATLPLHDGAGGPPRPDPVLPGFGGTAAPAAKPRPIQSPAAGDRVSEAAAPDRNAPEPPAPVQAKPSPFRRVEPLPPEEPEDMPAAPVVGTPTPPTPVGIAPTPAPVAEAPVPVPAAQPGPAPMPERQPDSAAPPKPVPVQEDPWIVRGELFRTYIIVEQGDTALLIDKHAAHERTNFDRLKAADYQPMVQELLSPVTFSLAPEEREALLEQTPLLERCGVDVEECGATALAVRTAPDYLEAGDIEPALLELARRLRVTGTADPAAAQDELLHTMACKAAIKGGWRSGAQELEAVARMVMSGAVKYCPHGRPVAIELAKTQLEKQFRRA